MNTYSEIELTKISLNPRNPRKACDPKALEELAASIKAKGVLEPIIVRPLGAGVFQVVAGERRVRAAEKVGLVKIPAIVREFTDEEAYDVAMIENLQRADLTDREEAESFKVYLTVHGGEGAAVELSEKTGIPPAYIRSRARVLTLPLKILKAWDEGKLVFGHLQQFLRVDDPAGRNDLVDWFFREMGWHGAPPVKELARRIEGQAPLLSGAYFKTKPGCQTCPSNSTVQKDLFGVDAGKRAVCLKSSCFKIKQTEFLTGNWEETEFAKKFGTKTFVFREGPDRFEYHRFGWQGKPGKKCRDCTNFVTILELSGKVDEEQACAGELSCFNAATRPKSAKEKATGERDPGAPRAKWHGEFFRDKFYRPRIEEEVGKLHFPVSDALALLLAAAVKAKGSYAVGDDVEAILGVKPAKPGRRGCEPVIEAVLQADAKTLEKLARAVVLWIVQDGQSRDPEGYNGFGTANRAAIGTFLGVDLAKEYAVDQEYLEKKTKAEILAFLKKFNLGPRFGDLETAAKLKKTELVKGILKLGPALVGKVPAEILK